MIERLTKLLAAAKDSLEAAGVTGVWYEINGGWDGDHQITIETSNDVEEDVPVSRLSSVYTEPSRTMNVIKVPKQAKEAIEAAFADIKDELFENHIHFHYDSKTFQGSGEILIYPPFRMMKERHEKILALRKDIQAVENEIHDLAKLL